MANDEAQLNSCLNLMRRLPPSAVENSLAGLIEMVPNLTDELLTHVDQPLKVHKDPKTNKSYVLCDYNRDGDSYRSPWSNEYFPPMADGFLPSKTLRDLEITANTLFDVYRKLYFEGGYSSAYFFDTDEKNEDSFGACFLIHKDVEQAKSLKKGWWDSIHVFEVTGDKDHYYVYKLTTTVMISMVLSDDKVGNVDLSGLRTQQDSKRLVVDAESPHIANMGKMLEDMELRIRNAIEGIYIQKTREVINGMRSATGKRDEDWKNIAQSLNSAVYQFKKKE
jgi:capping protein beta